MRSERPFLADIYPAGKYTCKVCGEKNLDGESFPMERGFSLKYLCPDCNSEVEKREKEKQSELYASGEEEPSFTDEIVCPWCGYEQSDPWEMYDSDDECECGNCEKIFSYERHVEVTYSSSRVE
jgi:DNA-directed RNA polymerase subunit RPC12/RpoP